MVTPLGGLLGALLGKTLIGHGRYRAIHIANVIIIVSTLLTLFDSVTAIALGRFVQGIASCGLSTVIVPKFIYETSPPSLRGPLGGLT